MRRYQQRGMNWRRLRATGPIDITGDDHSIWVANPQADFYPRRWATGNPSVPEGEKKCRA